MATYNGHKNWNHWNVALWIGSDEGLYNTARRHLRVCRTKDLAAREILAALRYVCKTHTPDGAPYTFSSIRAALRGL